MKAERNKYWISLGLWVAFIVILSGFIGNKQGVALSIQEDGLYFTTESGRTAELKWTDMQSVEIKADFPYGTLVEGTDDGKEKSGKWVNEEYGEYELYANASLSDCIVCRTVQNRIVAFNYESETSTHSLYDAIMQKQ